MGNFQRSALLSTTALAGLIGAAAMLAAPSPAYADCTPDPAVDGDSVVCTGTDADGFTTAALGIDIDVFNGATVASTISLGDGDDIIVNSGTITGDVDLGAGNDTITFVLNSGSMDGLLDGGAGLDLFRVATGSVDAVAMDLSNFVNFENFEVFFPFGGELTLTGTASFDEFKFRKGTLLLIGANLTVTSGIMSELGTFSTIAIDEFSTLTGTNGTAITDQDNLFVDVDGVVNGDILFGNDGGWLMVTGEINGNIEFGEFSDNAEFYGNATVRGNVSAGGGVGDDFLYAESDLTISLIGDVSGFETVEIGGPGTLEIAGNFVNGDLEIWEGSIDFVSGVSSLNSFVFIALAEDVPKLNVQAGAMLTVTEGIILPYAGQADVTIHGTLNSDVTLGSGGDLFTNSGTVNGNIDFQTGNDRIENSGTITGNVTLGDGNDTIIFSGGILNGNLDFGTGYDNLKIDLDTGFSPASITGTIDASASDQLSIYFFGIGTQTETLFQVQGFENYFLEGAITTTGGPGIIWEAGSTERFGFSNWGMIDTTDASAIVASWDYVGDPPDYLDRRFIHNGIVGGGTITVAGAADSHGIHVISPYFVIRNERSPLFFGAITVTSDMGHGIFAETDQVTVENDGLIETFTLTATGIADGIRIDGNSAGITNGEEGIIRTNGNNSAGIRTVSGNTHLIQNFGLIETWGASADGVVLTPTVADDDPLAFLGPVNSLINQPTGIIRVAGADSVAVRVNSQAGLGVTNITNRGLIESTGIAILGGDGNELVINEGDIVGNIDLGLGFDILGNSGTITGDVLFRDSGQFVNTGDVTGSVDLGPATMWGIGQIGGNLNNAGKLVIADSLGIVLPRVLSVDGNYTQTAAGALEIDIVGLDIDLLEIGGTATLDGALDIDLYFNDDEITTGQTYEFLAASGGVTGTFASITTNTSQFLDATVIYTANGVSVRLDRSSFLLPFFGAGRGAIARQLDAMAAMSATGISADFIRSLTFTERALGGFVMDQLASQAAADLPTPVIEARHGLLSHVSDRLVALGNYRGIEGKWVTSVTGFGEFGDTSGTKYATGGAMAVSAYGVSDRVTVGFAMAGTASDLNIATQYGDNGHKALDLVAFAAYRTGELSLSAMLGGSYDEADTERAVLAEGFEGRASGRMQGAGYSAAIDAQYALSFADIEITPRASFRVASFHHGAYEEREMGNLGLLVEGRTLTSLRSSAGINLKRSFGSKDGFRFTPEVGAYYEREFGDRERTANAAFIANPTGSFPIFGEDIDKNRTRLMAGFTAQLNDTVALGVHYEAALGARYDSHRITGGLRVAW